MEKSTSPVTDQIIFVLVHRKLSNFWSADVTGFWLPMPNFLTGILLRAPMRGVNDFDFTKKRRGKKFSSENIFHSRENISRILCDTL